MNENRNLYDVIILGAGISGLGCTYFSKKKFKNVLLIEKSIAFGGLAQTYQYQDFYYDSGAHRLHINNQELLNFYQEELKISLKKVTRPSAIFFQSKFVHFPLKPIDLIKNLTFKELLLSLFSYLKRPKILSPKNFFELSVSRYGKRLAKNFLLDYSEKLWGLKADKLSTEIAGSRIKGLTFMTFILDIFWKKRATEHLDGSFYYPQKGIGQLADILYEKVKDKTLLNTQITEIQKEDDYYILKTEQQTFKAKHIISTIPIPKLNELMNLKSKPLGELEFRDIILITFFLNKTKFTDFASLYFPEKHIPITRVYESKHRSEGMAPKGKTVICCEIPTQIKQEYNLEELKKVCIKTLSQIQPDVENFIIESEIKTIKYAYPILSNESKKILSQTKEIILSHAGISLCGRSASFRYLHIHDLIIQSRDLINSLS